MNEVCHLVFQHHRAMASEKLIPEFNASAKAEVETMKKILKENFRAMRESSEAFVQSVRDIQEAHEKTQKAMVRDLKRFVVIYASIVTLAVVSINVLLKMYGP